MLRSKILAIILLCLFFSGAFFLFLNFFGAKTFEEQENENSLGHSSFVQTERELSMEREERVLIDDEIEKNWINQAQTRKEMKLSLPMDRPQERIIKKTFGMFITPENSPIQPDKFKGFHTGIDWEVFREELNLEVEVRAICSGDLVLKKTLLDMAGWQFRRAVWVEMILLWFMAIWI